MGSGMGVPRTFSCTEVCTPPPMRSDGTVDSALEGVEASTSMFVPDGSNAGRLPGRMRYDVTFGWTLHEGCGRHT